VSKRRRSIGFKVQNGHITLQVPYGISKDVLREIVLDRLDWLSAKQAAQLALPKAPIRKLEAGEHWPLFGQSLVLALVEARQHRITVTGAQLLMEITPRQGSKQCQLRLLENWYKAQALDFAKRRVAYWQQVMAGDLSGCAASVQVRRFRSCWGSCSQYGELKFNWFLAMAPEYVFDYVVVHEMCHLQHMHHGREFWRMLSSYCPDYHAAKQWLKNNAYSLVLKLGP
jgi:hypothetical protein